MSTSDNRRASPPPAEASALEGMPHLAQKICAIWGQPDFEPFVNQLIMDSRDGRRQGLPWDAALDMLFLVELSVARRALAASEKNGMHFKDVFDQLLAQSRAAASGGDPWADPGNKDVRRQRGERSRTRPSGEIGNLPKKPWWQRLLG